MDRERRTGSAPFAGVPNGSPPRFNRCAAISKSSSSAASRKLSIALAALPHQCRRAPLESQCSCPARRTGNGTLRNPVAVVPGGRSVPGTALIFATLDFLRDCGTRGVALPFVRLKRSKAGRPGACTTRFDMTEPRGQLGRRRRFAAVAAGQAAPGFAVTFAGREEMPGMSCKENFDVKSRTKAASSGS